VLFGRGLAAVPASTATTLSLLEPAVAAVIAVLVLHERLSPLGWAGTGVLLAGLVVLTAPSRRTRPARRPVGAAISAPTRSAGG
jgi:DME family drug/metabolite transporter